MSRKIIMRYVLYFLLLVVLQIPLLHNWVLSDVAFPFPYIGFILLLPHTFQKGWSLTMAFFLGLLVDVFSNTPGIHASASVLIAFIRIPWLGMTTDSSNEDFELTLSYLKPGRFTVFVLPLIFIHHMMIFTLENEGFKWVGALLLKVLASTLFSCFLIWLVAFIATPSNRRR